MGDDRPDLTSDVLAEGSVLHQTLTKPIARDRARHPASRTRPRRSPAAVLISLNARPSWLLSRNVLPLSSILKNAHQSLQIIINVPADSEHGPPELSGEMIAVVAPRSTAASIA